MQLVPRSHLVSCGAVVLRSDLINNACSRPGMTQDFVALPVAMFEYFFLSHTAREHRLAFWNAGTRCTKRSLRGAPPGPIMAGYNLRYPVVTYKLQLQAVETFERRRHPSIQTIGYWFSVSCTAHKPGFPIIANTRICVSNTLSKASLLGGNNVPWMAGRERAGSKNSYVLVSDLKQMYAQNVRIFCCF